MYQEDWELYDNVFPLSSIRDSPLFRIAVKLNSDYSGTVVAGIKFFVSLPLWEVVFALYSKLTTIMYGSRGNT